MPHKDPDEARAYRKRVYEKRKGELAIKHREYYQKNKEYVKARVKKYASVNQVKVRESKRAYAAENKLKLKGSYAAWRLANKSKLSLKAKEDRAWKTDERKAYMKAYREKNREKIRLLQRTWDKANSDHIKVLDKAYYKANHDRIRAYKNGHYKDSYANNPQFKIATSLRARMRSAIKKAKAGKVAKSEDLLGASWDAVKIHLESLFKPGMTWENYAHDTWHIDHILPCTSFDLTDPEQQRQCFHFSNLQPLWALENLIKGDTLPPQDVKLVLIPV